MIAIKDDIIPELYQDRIYSMMTNTVFPWTFLEDVTYRENDVAKNINANATGTTGFAHLFYDILRKQLILKGIITQEDWDTMKNDIVIDYVRDNHFTELRDAELLREKIQTLDQISNYVGEYFSKEWIQKNVLMLSDEDIEQMKKDIEGESGEEPEEQEEQPAAQRFELKPVAQQGE